MNRQYVMGALISYGAIFFNILAGLLYTPWMVSHIGQSNYALYTLAYSFISIFLLDFGLGAAVSRFVAKYRAEGKIEAINELLGVITKIYLIIDFIIFFTLFILYFFIDYIYSGLTTSEIVIYKNLYIVVATYSIIAFPFMPLAGILNAYEKFIQLKLCDMGQKFLSILLVVIALLLSYGVVAIVTANAVSGIVFTIIKLFIIHTETNIRYYFGQINKKLMKEVFSFSVWITVISISQRFIFNLAPTILGIFSSSKQIAIIGPAILLEGFFYTFAAAINGMFLAKISRFVADRKEEKILPLMTKVGRYQVCLLGLIFVGFVCIGKDFLRLWMGKEYVSSWGCILLLFIPDIILFSQEIANTTMTAKNRVKEVAVGYVGMAIICTVLSSILCKQFGALGSCIAITVAYIFLALYMDYVYYKYLNIDIIKFAEECYIKLAPPILTACFFCYYGINRYIDINGWYDLIIKCILVTISYSGIIYALGLYDNEKHFLKNKISNLVSKART